MNKSYQEYIDDMVVALVVVWKIHASFVQQDTNDGYEL